ncbi:DUF2442 domain-containing protein [Desulfonatronospira sp.]|uniref:DUF2442 domain-containing protein n=1 Tax=Desulfonatronospira sp. TaxID=1962951 RepID=UPI0025BE988C|nr:DUF2442 domain-containing protein [Desulfonatronospira sp.]
MIPKIIDARYVQDYTIYIRFADGAEGYVDLKNELYGPMFDPLKQLDFFKQFSIHQDFCTLCWPNGADIAPEYLYEQIRVPA